MSRIRLLLADDHTVVRQGLRKVLEERPDWEVVAEAGDGREAVRLAEQYKPDVAILDVAMPLLNGIEATRQITKRVPTTRVLVLSMYADEAYVTQILQAGATGYLLKDSADVDLVQAVGEVAQGKSFFSPSIARVMLDDYVRQLADKGITDRYESLSEREREIFQLIAEGKSLMSKDNYHRFPSDEKVAGIDYAFYRNLLLGQYDDEVNRGLTASEKTNSGGSIDALVKA